MNGNNFILYFIGIISLFYGTLGLDFIPQIIEKIEIAVTPDKGIAYLNCTMVIMESQKQRASWYNILENKVIALGVQLSEPIRKDTYGNDKYIVTFIHKRPQYVPVMPGQSTDVWNYQLVVREVMATDSMNYFCRIDMTGFEVKYKPEAVGKIILQKAPFISPIPSQIVEEGKRLYLECRAEGSPTPRITWIKANGESFSLPGSPQRVVSSVLILPKVGRYDRGIYRCHAQNNVGKADEYDVMVEVSYRPTVRQARRLGAYAQMPNQNYEIMVECIVNGYPDPDLFWYKGVYNKLLTNELIQNGVRYETQKIVSYGAVGTNITDVFFVMKILNIQEEDFSNYTCRAENRIGTHQSVINIFKQQVCQGAMCFMAYGPGGGAQSTLSTSMAALSLIIFINLLNNLLLH